MSHLTPLPRSAHALEHLPIEEQLARWRERCVHLEEELEALAFFASHDFQEPLVIQNMFIRILQHELKHELSDEAVLAIDALSTSSRRMHNMVLAMLAYSRVGRAPLVCETLDMDLLADAALEKLAGRIAETGAKIHRTSLGNATGDRGLVVQLFEQLLDNALKFHTWGAQPQISISAELNGSRRVFTVQDNGIGIEAEDIATVFRPFKRLHPKDKYVGVGVGLSICRKIVEKHGGAIWMESTPGAGAKVHFILQQ